MAKRIPSDFLAASEDAVLTDMSSQTNHLFRFDPFLLLTEERLLMREGKVVPLSPKVLETLLVLVENNGRILSKEELMQSLWPDTYVEESNLTQNISQIRKALGDGEWVETIPKRGYRFAAPVQIEVESNGASNGTHLADNGAAFTNGHDYSTPLPAIEPPFVITPEIFTASKSSLNPRWVLALIVGLVVFSLVTYFSFRRTATHASKSFQQFKPIKLTTSGQARQSAISHDGKYVALVEGASDAQSLLVRQVKTMSQCILVPPSDSKFLGVTFSPDDTFVYYVAQTSHESAYALYQIPLLGGGAKKMLSNVDSPVTLSPDGQAVAFVRRFPAQAETALMLAKLDNAEERKLLTRQRPESLALQGPAWSADGKVIACAVSNDVSGVPDMQILTVNPLNGSALTIGNEHWSATGQLAWLGDGSGLVFNAWRSTSGVYGDPLWLLNYPGGEVRQITNDLSGYQGSSVAADSSALVTRQLTRVSRLWVMFVNGESVDVEHATQIQSGFGDNFSEYFGLDWTPDGRLVYGSHASANLDLWRSTTDGKQQQLTRDNHLDGMPMVAADGRYIVFVSDRGGTRTLWRTDIDGNNPKQLTHGRGDAWPSLTPDGKWVVYSALNQTRPVIWKVSIEGGEPIALTDKTTFHPRVSSDGKWIACFWQDDKDFKIKLAVLPIAGGELSVIEPAAFPDYGVIGWMPDSRALCYSVTRHGVSNLWRSPLDGGKPTQLTQFTTEQIFRFAWSRDGRQLACERGHAISDVVLISNQ